MNLMETQIAILQFLLTVEESYGHEIRTTLKLELSNCYSALSLLENEGFIRGEERPYRNRKLRYYRITDSGKLRKIELTGQLARQNSSLQPGFAPA